MASSRVLPRVVALIAWTSLSVATHVTAAAPTGATDGDWPMPARDYASTRFSPLTEINAANAPSLKLAFTFSTGVLRGHEAAPLVVERHDVRRHAVPEHRLRARPVEAGRAGEVEVRAAAKRVGAGRRVLRRGEPRRRVRDGRVFFNTLDGQTIALDASTGKELWRTRLGDIRTARRSPWRRWW
jgi:glucose dehydrogenase